MFFKRAIFQVYVANLEVYLNNFVKRNATYTYVFVLIELRKKYLCNKTLESSTQAIKKTSLLSKCILKLKKFFASRKFFEVLKLRQ